MNYNKLTIDVEFSQGDEFMNYNVCNVDKWEPANDSPPQKGAQGGVNQQQNDDDDDGAVAKNLGKGAAALVGATKQAKAKPKPIETEYLRTDYKLANIPSPVNMK